MVTGIQTPPKLPMKYVSKSLRFAILTGSILAATEATSQAVILYQQNFDTDPVDYTASPFQNQGTGLDTSSRYWDLKNNIPATILNPGILGNDTNYVTGQNMDAPLPFTATAPAFIDVSADIGNSV